MAILYATNSPTSIGGTSSGSYYDAAYVDRSTFINNGYYGASIPFPTSTGNDTWLHWQQRMDSADGADDGWCNMIFDTNGAELVRFEISNGTWRLELRGTGTIVGSYIAVGLGVNTFDVKLSIPGDGSIYAEWWKNDILQTSISDTIGTKTQPAYIRYGGSDSGGIYVSQLLIMETSTVGRHLADLKPGSAGNYTAWTGNFTELGDANNASGAYTGAIAQRESSLLAAYGGPTTGGVEGIFVSGTSLKAGAPTPTSVVNFVRVALTDYDGVADTVDQSPTEFDTIWATNPNTAVAWTFADLGTMEIGILSS